MTVTVDTIRTVFEAQFTGANAVRAFVREIGIAKAVTDSVFGSRGSMRMAAPAVSDFQKALNASKVTQYNRVIKDYVDLVNQGTISAQTAEQAIQMVSDSMGMSAEATVEAAEGMAFFGTNLGKAAVVAGGAAAGIALVTTALVKLYPVAQEGAGLEQLSRSFHNLNQNVLHTPGLLGDMREAANYTISSFGAMEAFLTMTAGASRENAQEFARFAPKLMEIAKAANVLNPRLGDTNFMFNSLARGIKRAEQRLVDNLGLNVKFGEANKRLADELGKTVAQLTAEEKQLAALYETVRVGDQLLAQVGGNIESLADAYLKLGAAAEEAQGQLKINIAQQYPAGGLMGLTDALNAYSVALEKKNIIERANTEGLLTAEEYQGAWAMSVHMSADELRAYIDLVQRYHQQEADAYRQAMLSGIRPTREMADALLLLRWARWELDSSPDPAESTLPDASYRTSFDNYNDYLSSNAKWRSKMADANEEAAEKEAEANKKIEESYKSLMKEVLAHNDAVQEAYRARVAATGDALMAVSGEDAGFYTRDIEELGDAWVTVGGRTQEQNELLEDFENAMGRAQDTVRDYSTGLKGFGEDQDKINKKIGKASAEVEFFKGKIEGLRAIQGTPILQERGAEWDIDKLEEYLIGANDEAGAGAILLADLKIKTDEWGEAQAVAAIKAASMAGALERIAAGGMPAAEQLEEMHRILGLIDNMDLSTIFGDFASGDELIESQLGELGDKIFQKAVQDRDGLPMTKKVAEGIFGGLEETALLKAEAAREAMLAGLFPDATAPPAMNKLNVEWEEGDIDDMAALIKGLPSTHYVNIVPIGVPDGYDPSIPRHAAGGFYSGYSPFLVGERGPEVVIPTSPGGGRVIPNHELGGNTVINQNYYNAQAAAIGEAQMQRIRSGR